MRDGDTFKVMKDLTLGGSIATVFPDDLIEILSERSGEAQLYARIARPYLRRDGTMGYTEQKRCFMSRRELGGYLEAGYMLRVMPMFDHEVDDEPEPPRQRTHEGW